MVPRRKLINHGEAKATRTAAAAETSETAGSDSRTWISPNDETPTSNGSPARRRVAAHPAKPATPASSARPALNGADAVAAASNTVEETSAMPSPTRRHCRARDDGCSVVHGTSTNISPMQNYCAPRSCVSGAQRTSVRLRSSTQPRRCSLRFSSGCYTRLNTSVPLVPPNPKEFFSATSIRISRAVLAQ
jgi:hypothetical protein